jgi:hypothetical protein
MSSPLQKIVSAGAAVLHSPSLGGREFRGAGDERFIALIEDADPIAYGLPIGDDPREQAILHVLPGVNSRMPDIISQDTITDDANGQWHVVKRIQSEASIDTRYYMVKVA